MSGKSERGGGERGNLLPTSRTRSLAACSFRAKLSFAVAFSEGGDSVSRSRKIAMLYT